MPPVSENAYYFQGAFAELQGEWLYLRQAVLKLSPTESQQKLLSTIDQAMSWESVRNLSKMQQALSQIRQQVHTENFSSEIIFWVEDIQLLLDKLQQLQAGLRLSKRG